MVAGGTFGSSASAAIGRFGLGLDPLGGRCSATSDEGASGQEGSARRVGMGAKSWILAYCTDDRRAVLRRGPVLDRDAARTVVERLFPGRRVATAGEGDPVRGGARRRPGLDGLPARHAQHGGLDVR